MTYIPSEIADQIRTAAQVEEVIPDYVTLKKKGTSQVGDCPQCGAKGKLSVSAARQIWKCWACNVSGKDAISFLTTVKEMSYPDALQHLAGKYGIVIPDPEKPKRGKGKKGKDRFRDIQLLQSGIPHKAQVWYLLKEKEKAKVEMDRYQAATINQEWNVVAGDDMVLHYLDLDGTPLTYVPKGKTRRALIRVRWQNPELHHDQAGKPIKYQTPPGAGSPLWIPQWMIDAYARHAPLHTLFITEGEKKADALCQAELPAVGITGIHNFGTQGDMPRQLELIVRRGGVKRVCFLLDSDWQELHAKPGGDIARRPNLFFRAVLNFQKYFRAFSLEGLDVQIFFGAGRETVYKGVDDLIMRGIPKATTLAADLEKAFIDREGMGTHVQVFDITSMSDYKLKEIWHLHSPQAFRDHHAEALTALKEFTHNGMKYRVVDGQIELDQKILPHEEYWTEIHDKFGGVMDVRFDHYRINDFLRNRGWMIYLIQGLRNAVRFVHVDEKVVRDVTPLDIKRFVLQFTEEIDRIDVLRMLLKGSKSYFSPDKLEHMREFIPQLIQPEPDVFYMIFQEQFWKVTAARITSHPLRELPGHIWDNQIIKFSPKLLKAPILDIGRDGDDWIMTPSAEYEKCDIAQFFVATSNYFWREATELIDTPDGIVFRRKEGHVTTPEQKRYNQAHLVAKMLATGYVIHDYRNWAQMKAVVAVDHEESEVGRAEGGTGKSIWCTMFERLMPTVVIDAKKPRLQDDAFLYGFVDERTRAIVFDDCRMNMDFEYFLSQITRGIEVNPKGGARFNIPAPKMLFSTNHAVRGEGNTFERRQYYIAFSDYFHKHRSPRDEFGHNMFYEWDWDQWNLFYNFMANCVQTYLRFNDLNTYTIPSQNVERRRRRQAMGEEFLEFMQSWWHEYINCAVERSYAFEECLRMCPSHRKWMSMPAFKARVKDYASYAGFQFNPGADKSGRIRAGNEEFIIVADTAFDKFNIQYVRRGYVQSSAYL